MALRNDLPHDGDAETFGVGSYPDEITDTLIASKESEWAKAHDESVIDKHCGPGSWLYCFLTYLLLPTHFVRNVSVPLLDEDGYDWRYVTGKYNLI